MVRYALTGRERSVLDLGVGTAQSLGTFLKAHTFEQAVGCDFSEEMLQRARARLDSLTSKPGKNFNHGRTPHLVACDFHELPFPSGSFDFVTGSFILRSVQSMPQFLSEVKRVLEPGGKAVFLELTRPTHPFVWHLFYRPYLKFCVPAVGKLFSRHDHAYQFLSESVQAFQEPEGLRREFEEAGFRDVSINVLSLGVATLVRGFVR